MAGSEEELQKPMNNLNDTVKSSICKSTWKKNKNNNGDVKSRKLDDQSIELHLLG